MIRPLIDSVGRIMPSSSRSAMRTGFLLGAVVGLSIVLFVRPVIMGKERGFGGSGHDGYLELGGNIIRGRGYVFEPGGPPVIHRPPVVPVLISPVTLLPASLQQPALVVLHSLLFAATCMLLYRLADRLLGRRIARVSVGCVLFYPWVYWHIKNPMSVITQMFFTVLVAELLCAELFSGRSGPDGEGRCRRWIRPAGLALASGGAVLTHGTALVSVPCLILLSVLVSLARRNLRSVGRLLAAAALAILLVAPWTYRNWRVTGRVVPVAGNAGFAYFLGQVHWSDNAPTPPDARSTRLRTLDMLNVKPTDVHYYGIKDPVVETRINEMMKAHALSHPGRLARKCVLNAIEFYLPTAHDVLRPEQSSRGAAFLENIGLSVWHAAFWVFAIIGLCKAGRGAVRVRLASVVVTVLLLALPFLPFLVFVGHSQYSLHTIPLLAIPVAFGVVSLLGGKPTGCQQA